MGCGCYTFSVVEYVKLGRRLGIGTRVAAKILRDRAQNTPASSNISTPAAKAEKQAQPRPPEKRASRVDPRITTRNVTRGAIRGSRGFGRAFWTPFMRAVRALWHEVTGVFFAIFALFFAQSLWKVRGDWLTGPQHHRFLVYLILLLAFGYFSIAAFVTSRRTQR